MKVPFFDLGAQFDKYRPELHAALDKTLDAGYFIGGNSVGEFESKFAEKTGSAWCSSVGNGLDALRLILEALDIGEGDEVIVPGFTFYATWLAVLQVGATPVFVDVEPSTANLDPEKINASINNRTKAVLVVHLFGQLANVKEILEICENHGVQLIEDCAQSHFASNSIGSAGTFGVAAAFSFYPTKNLGALGDGGAITTNDARIYDFVNSRRSYGRGVSKYEHVDLGWNSRLDSLQAEFLILHLSKIDEFIEVRRFIAQRYIDSLGSLCDYLVGPQQVSDSVWHHFVLKSRNRSRSIEILNNLGVGTDIHYPYFAETIAPVTRYLASKSSPLPAGTLFNSESLANQVFSLPIGPWMSEAQIEHVTQGLASEDFRKSFVD